MLPRMRRVSTRTKTVVADVCAAMENLAPTALAQEWDNVGLLAGDLQAAVRRVLLTIDLTAAVVDEAIRKKVEFIISYHPPVFKPITSLRAPVRPSADRCRTPAPHRDERRASP